MMGPDCEQALQICIKLINMMNEISVDAANACMYPIEVSLLTGIEVPKMYFANPAPLSNYLSSINEFHGKMNSLNDDLYTSSSSFNNSHGSPWSEFNRMIQACNDTIPYMGNLGYIGEKSALADISAHAMQRSIDAKYAIIIYHDYLQRGFDKNYHDNQPSITTKKNVNDQQTFGNVKQQYNDNVNLKEPSIDPF